MGPLTTDLLETLSRLINLLEGEEELHWASWLRKSKSRIETSDYSGIEYLLSAYGGMGSFSDLVICVEAENGFCVVSDKGKSKNELLEQLRGHAWWLANEIKHAQIEST